MTETKQNNNIKIFNFPRSDHLVEDLKKEIEYKNEYDCVAHDPVLMIRLKSLLTNFLLVKKFKNGNEPESKMVYDIDSIIIIIDNDILVRTESTGLFSSERKWGLYYSSQDIVPYGFLNVDELINFYCYRVSTRDPKLTGAPTIYFKVFPKQTIKPPSNEKPFRVEFLDAAGILLQRLGLATQNAWAKDSKKWVLYNPWTKNYEFVKMQFDKWKKAGLCGVLDTYSVPVKLNSNVEQEITPTPS
jgi:hypothetical protein